MLKKLYTSITGSSLPRFAAVGGINTLIDFGILNLLVFLGHTASFVLFNQEFLIANAIAFSVAMTNSFIWNQLWVFPDSKQQNKNNRQIILFIVITVTSIFIIQQVLFNILYYTYLHNKTFISLNMAKLIATTISVSINFLGYRYLVFRKSSKVYQNQPEQSPQSEGFSVRKDATP